MKPGELRRFNDDHAHYPGQVFLVIEIEEMEPDYPTLETETSVTFLIDGNREFGWHGGLLEENSEVINEAR